MTPPLEPKQSSASAQHQQHGSENKERADRTPEVTKSPANLTCPPARMKEEKQPRKKVLEITPVDLLPSFLAVVDVDCGKSKDEGAEDRS